VKKSSKKLKAEKLAAFETLVSEYERPLLRYAGRILRDQHAAQDIVQDTFIRLFKRWAEPWVPSPQLASWLYRVAHNCAVDYVRKESRKRLLHQREALEKSDPQPPKRGTGIEISERAELAASALQTLSLREQQLVVLKVYEEKSYKEISEIAGLTTSNVGYILHHAMKKMAAVMRGSQEAEGAQEEERGNE
jgi:RNA polymerase sigma factor (sigma-70 family)